MKSFRRQIDLFCYRNPRFGIPNLMKYICIASVVFWLVGKINPVLSAYLTFDPALVMQGQVWRILTFMLYPAGSSILTLLVIYCYYLLGSALEARWGAGPFTLFFLIGVVLTLICGFVIYFVTGIRISLTATYVYLSMFLAFAVMFPESTVLFMYIIPIKMKYVGIIDLIYFVYAVFFSGIPYAFIPFVAFMNFLLFCGSDLRNLFSFIPPRQSKSAINFKKASAQIRRQQEYKLYNHKCSVCGRTDTEYPDLEFRYCSQCQGYHCFCADHINSHIHFTE